eukprot:jgi/Chlat1/4183/Chrsp27S08877
MLTSRPAGVAISHDETLAGCMEHAKKFMSADASPVDSAVLGDVTYKRIHECLARVVSSAYFTMTPDLVQDVHSLDDVHNEPQPSVAEAPVANHVQPASRPSREQSPAPAPAPQPVHAPSPPMVPMAPPVPLIPSISPPHTPALPPAGMLPPFTHDPQGLPMHHQLGRDMEQMQPFYAPQMGLPPHYFQQPYMQVPGPAPVMPPPGHEAGMPMFNFLGESKLGIDGARPEMMRGPAPQNAMPRGGSGMRGYSGRGYGGGGGGNRGQGRGGRGGYFNDGGQGRGGYHMDAKSSRGRGQAPVNAVPAGTETR